MSLTIMFEAALAIIAINCLHIDNHLREDLIVTNVIKCQHYRYIMHVPNSVGMTSLDNLLGLFITSGLVLLPVS